jgi:hypothetical protein
MTVTIGRRELLAAFGGAAAAWPLSAHAQRSGVSRIGFLNAASPAQFVDAAFREGLREAGFIEGQNVTIEYRWANNDYAKLPQLANDLVGRRVAVIAATGDIASARAAQAATSKIPIVFTVGSDPVPFGLVDSLSRPTGNATGVTLFSSTLMAKRLEFLREVAPGDRPAALLMNPDNLNFDVDIKAAEDAAKGPRAADVRDPGAQSAGDRRRLRHDPSEARRRRTRRQRSDVSRPAQPAGRAFDETRAADRGLDAGIRRGRGSAELRHQHPVDVP